MADPFEVRMRFTSQLQHLNASVTSSQKAAHYALKYRDMDEDLHSCILEQLERNSMNNRANIMFFIEHLCDMAQRENHMEYVNMMRRDILRVVDAVAPEDGSGAANVKVIRRVLQGLQQKSILQPQNVLEIEACLKERDTLPANAVLSPPSPHSVVAGDGGGVGGGSGGGGSAEQRQQQQQLSSSSASSTTRRPLETTAAAAAATAATANTPRSSRPNGGVAAAAAKKLDKRQIEQRIEEDRERHKRFRESIWAVSGDDDAEFDRLWDEASELGEDDYLAAEEDKIERETAEVAACR